MNKSASTIFAAFLAVLGLFSAQTAFGQQFDLGKIVNGPAGQQFRQEFQQHLPQVIDHFKNQVMPPNFRPGNGFPDFAIDPVPGHHGPNPIMPYPGTGKPHPPEFIVDPVPVGQGPDPTYPGNGQPHQPWQPSQWQPTHPQGQPQYIYPSTPQYTQPHIIENGIQYPSQPVTEQKTTTSVEQTEAQAQAKEPDPNGESDEQIEELPEVELGTVVRIEGENFGDEPGAVYLKIDKLILKTELVDWDDTYAEAELPNLAIIEVNTAIIIIMRADAKLGKTMEVQLTPARQSDETVESDEEETDEEASNDESEADATPTVTAGQELTIEGDLGNSNGKVELRIGIMSFPSKILNWSETAVDFEIPSIQATQEQAAELVITNGDDQEVDTIIVNYSPARE